MTADMNPLSVGFISLGCAKNLVDSQVMAEHLTEANLSLAPQPESADIIVVNTCAFIEEAREESMEAILSACEFKQQGNCQAVIVCGCLPQRYRDRIMKALPDVDAFLGLDSLERLPTVIRELSVPHSETSALEDIPEQSTKLYNPKSNVIFSTGAHAFIKIAEGCNHHCAFCAIPAIRGRHRSRPEKSILEEAIRIVAKGFRELDLVAQDIMAYGTDLEKPATLAGLIRQIGQIPGDFWIRLLYGYPALLTDDLLEAIATTPKVCPYLDIPIQHSHPDILKAMKRHETIVPVNQMIDRIRHRIPQAAIRTTCLVGFPGETDEHFQHLMNYCRDAQFDHLGVFVFSPEEGTHAFDLSDLPDLEIAESRRDQLMAQQQAIVAAKLAQRIGHKDTVLVDQVDNTGIRGHNRYQAPDVDGCVIISDNKNNLKKGDWTDVVYAGIDNYDLIAHLC